MTKFYVAFLLPLLICFSFINIVSAQGTVIDDSFASPSLNNSTQMVDVYLPEGYDAANPDGYQVIYFLHGANGNQDSYPFIIGIMDGLIGAGTIQPTIMVKPTGNQGLYMSSFYKNSELNGKVGDYITQDLITYIDTTYNTKADQNKRAIMGHSMGGMGSQRLAMKYPELYRAVASHSGPHDIYQFQGSIDSLLNEYPGGAPYVFTPFTGVFSGLSFALSGAYSPNRSVPFYMIDYPVDRDGNAIDEILDRWKAESAFTYAKQADPAELAVWMDCGEFDELGVFPYNEAYSDSLNMIGFPHHYESYPGSHSNGLPNQFPKSIVWLDSVMNSPATAIEPTLVERILLAPNPFSEKVSLQFHVKSPATVKISVHNTMGQQVARLMDKDTASGHQEVTWRGAGITPGMYFFRIQVGDQVEIRKVVFKG